MHEDSITVEQYSVLKELALLCDNDITTPVSVYCAALKAGQERVRAYHNVLALLELGMVHSFTNQMMVNVTARGVLYCDHRKGKWFMRLWHAHTEAIIRGCIGAFGAMTGSILTLVVRHYLMGLK